MPATSPLSLVRSLGSNTLVCMNDAGQLLGLAWSSSGFFTTFNFALGARRSFLGLVSTSAVFLSSSSSPHPY